MSAKLCSPIKSDTTSCRAVALAGHALCFAHNRQLRRQHARRHPAVRLGPLADQPSIQRAINRVFQALAPGSLQHLRAMAYLQRITRAMAQRNRAAALLASARSLDLPAFALTPARLYNQPNPSTHNPQPATCN